MFQNGPTLPKLRLGLPDGVQRYAERLSLFVMSIFTSLNLKYLGKIASERTDFAQALLGVTRRRTEVRRAAKSVRYEHFLQIFPQILFEIFLCPYYLFRHILGNGLGFAVLIQILI